MKPATAGSTATPRPPIPRAVWLLGLVSGYTLGNFIWILLVIAVVLFLVRLVSGRRV